MTAAEFREQMLVDVAEIKGDVKQLVGAKADHETRLRSIERWRYGLPAALLGSVASLVWTVLHAPSPVRL